MKKQTNKLNTHNGALEHLVNHLDIVGIDRLKVDWVIKELDILKPNSVDQEKACDIVVGYDTDKLVDLIELKHSKECSVKARTQLYNTNEHFVERIGYKTRDKYIVYYPTMESEKIW
jgi:hypothetical protein